MASSLAELGGDGDAVVCADVLRDHACRIRTIEIRSFIE
jgi:hypothetical protein